MNNSFPKKLKNYHHQKIFFIGILSFRFFIFYLKVFMIGARYIAERIGERAESWSMLTLVLNKEEEKLFHEYVVDQLE